MWIVTCFYPKINKREKYLFSSTNLLDTHYDSSPTLPKYDGQLILFLNKEATSHIRFFIFVKKSVHISFSFDILERSWRHLGVAETES